MAHAHAGMHMRYARAMPIRAARAALLIMRRPHFAHAPQTWLYITGHQFLKLISQFKKSQMVAIFNALPFSDVRVEEVAPEVLVANEDKR